MKKIFTSNNIENIGNIECLASGYYEEKKSKFYSYVFDVSKKKQATEIINRMQEEFKEARHVVYAYVVENEFSYSDDGEPSGTAGKMIYSLMEKQNITNTLIVVIRYFGGILLGVGPLSRAYLKAVKVAEEKLRLEEYIPKKEIKIECTYKEEPFLRNIIDKTGSFVIDVTREENVIYLLNISENDEKEFRRFQKN
mgnify:CR=1 FL=1